MKDKEKIKLYRHALSQLCKDCGGEVFIKLDDLESGSLMNKLENGGVRFKYVPDTIRQ